MVSAGSYRGAGDLFGWENEPKSSSTSVVYGASESTPEQGSWERNRSYLERMEFHDPLLIYRNQMGRYTATGRVGSMPHTERIREEASSCRPVGRPMR